MTFLLYLTWHFYETPRRMLQIWRNYFIFVWHYFSVDLLSRTFFKPWRHALSIKKSPGFEMAEFFTNLAFNIFSRLVGFFVRSFTIVFALFLEILVFIIGTVIFIFWLVLPFILIFSFYKSFQIYFYGF